MNADHVNGNARARTHIAERPVNPVGALKADVWRMYGRFNWGLLVKATLLRHHFRPQLTYRLFHCCAGLPAPVRTPLRLLLRIIHRGITTRRCMQLPMECTLGPGLLLEHAYGLIVNKAVTVGANCTTLHAVTLGSTRGGVPRIGDNVTIAAGAMIIGPLLVGNGSTIGAASLVVKDVPERCTAAGHPATVIGRRDVPSTRNPAPLEVFG